MKITVSKSLGFHNEKEKRMIKLLLVVLLLFFSGSSKKEIVPATDQNTDSGYTESFNDEDSVWNYAGSSQPVKLTYIRGYETCSSYETEDPELISACVDAVKVMKLGEETDLCALDADDTLYFEMENGDSYSLMFEAGILVRDGNRYEVSGFSVLSKVLERIACE